jgi:hypothetical protein
MLKIEEERRERNGVLFGGRRRMAISSRAEGKLAN